MASIKQRITALEQRLGVEELTVVIVQFGDSDYSPSRYTSGAVPVSRESGEEVGAFRDRAIADLRAGRPGLVTVVEG